ncbi:hypothetical protein SAMN04487948_1164 [Halogranum amylolyticum]|uniref:Uncharacterized protein n=1 Tax=Halogranum amylolyticum TaxID=660520 RepID=A0A1H8VE99_9EURY|nr:hypothetical protein SAMN04487948_1164 [Halogranum amylolyticum]
MAMGRSPTAGGCWTCYAGNGHEGDTMSFDIEFDTFYREKLP